MSLYLGTEPVAAPHQSLSNIVDAFFPVGSCYIGVGSTCPLAAIKGTWTLQSSGIVTSVNTSVPVKGTGKTLGLTNGTDNVGMNVSSWSAVRFYPDKNAFNKAVGTDVNESVPADRDCYGVTTDASKSGIVGTVTRSVLSVNIWKRTA